MLVLLHTFSLRLQLMSVADTADAGYRTAGTGISSTEVAAMQTSVDSICCKSARFVQQTASVCLCTASGAASA